jgi:hypothetical protein
MTSPAQNALGDPNQIANKVGRGPEPAPGRPRSSRMATLAGTEIQI